MISGPTSEIQAIVSIFMHIANADLKLKGEEIEVIFRDAYVSTFPTTLAPLQWQELAPLCMEWFPAGALPCIFFGKKLLDALLSRSICFFLLFAA